MAAFVTFVRVVRPLLLRLAGALPEPLDVAPARATFQLSSKKKDRREYVRVFAKRGADGMIEVTEISARGRGLVVVADRDGRLCRTRAKTSRRSSRATRSAISPYAS